MCAAVANRDKDTVRDGAPDAIKNTVIHCDVFCDVHSDADVEPVCGGEPKSNAHGFSNPEHDAVAFLVSVQHTVELADADYERDFERDNEWQ